MKQLVLSDSHSSLRFMRLCMDKVKPEGVIHLGDYYDDGEVLKEEYPGVLFRQVPGNCDRYRCPPFVQEILIDRIFGVDFYLTHGHKHGVKMELGKLLRDAKTANVQAVLYGHTHIPNCYQDQDGLWVMNPGSCGYGATAGLIRIEDGIILHCAILNQGDLEEIS